MHTAAFICYLLKMEIFYLFYCNQLQILLVTKTISLNVECEIDIRLAGSSGVATQSYQLIKPALKYRLFQLNPLQQIYISKFTI